MMTHFHRIGLTAVVFLLGLTSGSVVGAGEKAAGSSSLPTQLGSQRLVRDADGKVTVQHQSQRVCPPDQNTDGCTSTNLTKAVAAASNGDTIVLAPGVYRQAAVLRANGVTIKGEPGAHITGAAARGKGALVIAGRNTVIEGLECSNVTVPDGNGACIRLENENLTLRRMHIHGNQMGVLTGHKPGLVRIEDSVIERNGKEGGSWGHNVYVGGGELEISRSRILAARHQGHEVKSRAARTLIEDSVIASLDAIDSRLVDVPNGGELVIRNSVLEEGPKTSNHDIIGVGLEGVKHEINTVRLEDNTIIIDNSRGGRLIHSAGTPPPVVSGNTIVGGSRFAGKQNTWYRDRRQAGLAPYPYLPPYLPE